MRRRGKVDGTSTLPSQSTSALHTAVPADNMPADTDKEAVTKRHLVTVIGDSVFLGASVAFQQQCENAVVDAKISRQVVQALDVAKQLDKKHKLGDIVIIALGTNSNFNSKSGQKLIDYLGKDRTIYWIDTYGKHLDIQKMSIIRSNGLLQPIKMYSAFIGPKKEKNIRIGFIRTEYILIRTARKNMLVSLCR